MTSHLKLIIVRCQKKKLFVFKKMSEICKQISVRFVPRWTRELTQSEEITTTNCISALQEMKLEKNTHNIRTYQFRRTIL